MLVSCAVGEKSDSKLLHHQLEHQTKAIWTKTSMSEIVDKTELHNNWYWWEWDFPENLIKSCLIMINENMLYKLITWMNEISNSYLVLISKINFQLNNVSTKLMRFNKINVYWPMFDQVFWSRFNDIDE
jgi:hypothetical protein